mmetsp:Transcript_12809/g.49071  ORF Transcript_12809/g.49071 Transcript_12809/m.49071 type:complete len:232 (+) Transcript_12809:512-1207(+)
MPSGRSPQALLPRWEQQASRRQAQLRSLSRPPRPPGRTRPRRHRRSRPPPQPRFGQRPLQGRGRRPCLRTWNQRRSRPSEAGQRPAGKPLGRRGPWAPGRSEARAGPRRRARRRRLPRRCPSRYRPSPCRWPRALPPPPPPPPVAWNGAMASRHQCQAACCPGAAPFAWLPRARAGPLQRRNGATARPPDPPSPSRFWRPSQRRWSRALRQWSRATTRRQWRRTRKRRRCW